MIKRLPNGSRAEETLKNKTKTQGKSFLFLLLSKNGIWLAPVILLLLLKWKSRNITNWGNKLPLVSLEFWCFPRRLSGKQNCFFRDLTLRVRFFGRIQKRICDLTSYGFFTTKNTKIRKGIIYHDNDISSCSLWEKKDQQTDKKKKQYKLRMNIRNVYISVWNHGGNTRASFPFSRAPHVFLCTCYKGKGEVWYKLVPFTLWVTNAVPSEIAR